jgi:AcrR family transcriptional regulator
MATKARARTTRRRRGSINSVDIIDGAFEVARRTTLDQLSMPILAEHLGVGVTSIYWYFRKKDDLLDAMAEVAVTSYVDGLPAVREDQTWQEVLSAFFHYSRDRYSKDHVLSDLVLIRPATFTSSVSRRIFQGVEAVVAKLVDSGFTPDNAFLAFNAGSVFTRGMIVHDRLLRLSGADMDQDQRTLTDWSSMPVLGSMLGRHALVGTTEEDFEFGLARLICGFSVLLAEQPTQAGAGGSSRRATAGVGRVAAKANQDAIAAARPVRRLAAAEAHGGDAAPAETGDAAQKTMAVKSAQAAKPAKASRATKATVVTAKAPARSAASARKAGPAKARGASSSGSRVSSE